MVFFFTGTGNSRFAAMQIHRIVGGELVSMNEELRRRIQSPAEARWDFVSEEALVFVCPTYCYRLPHVVEDFIRQSRFGGNRDAYFFLTCGADTGAAAKLAERFCGEVGLRYRGTDSAVMPENFITLFDSPDYDEALTLIRTAVSGMESAARLMAQGRPLTDSHAASPVKSLFNKSFYKFFVTDKGFTVSDSCVSCGKCAELCPLCNITLENGRPQWHGNCTMCNSCINVCPRNAIEYGRRSRGKRRYYLFDDGSQKK